MKVYSVFFSPTGTGRRVSAAVSSAFAAKSGAAVENIDLTFPEARASAALSAAEGDLLILEFPVYGGRVPGLLLDAFGRLKGNGAMAVILAVYGNRHYDDAMLEASDLLQAQGFKVVGAAAFLGEHSLTANVATGRPDEADLAKAAAFGEKLADKLAGEAVSEVQVWGHRPLKAKGAPAKLAPKTKDTCVKCGLCVRSCPMQIISAEDPSVVGEGCINCHACEKCCPVKAKYFDQEGVLKVIAFLEGNFTARREPEIYL